MILVANSLSGGERLTGYPALRLMGRSDAEFVCGTVSCTSVTSLERGLSYANGTTFVSSLKFAHRKGANVKVTDFPLIQPLSQSSNGDIKAEHRLDRYPLSLDIALFSSP
jgi:hypothetical protein